MVVTVAPTPSGGHFSQPIEELDAIPRRIIGTRPLRSRTIQGIIKKVKVFRPVNLGDAETGQVRGAPLHVQQSRTEFTHQPQQSSL